MFTPNYKNELFNYTKITIPTVRSVSKGSGRFVLLIGAIPHEHISLSGAIAGMLIFLLGAIQGIFGAIAWQPFKLSKVGCCPELKICWKSHIQKVFMSQMAINLKLTIFRFMTPNTIINQNQAF